MISWSRVQELRDEIGGSDFDEVVDLFLEEVEEVIAKIKTDAEPRDLGNDLHFLKGSAMSLGFQGFSTLCRDAELLSAEGKSDQIDLDALFSNYEESKSVFVSGLAEHVAN